MEAKRRWLIPLGFAAVCVLAGANAPSAGSAQALVAMAGLNLIAAAGFALHYLWRRRDPYSLEALREVHDREEVRDLLSTEMRGEGDEAVCPHCGHTYPTRLPICPHCRQRG